MTAPAGPTVDQFFAGGGGKSISWKDQPIGTTIQGTIKQVHPPQPQTDPAKPGVILYKKDGVTPKMQVRIDLATDMRDPSDPDDDGSRGLYVQGWMQGAIGDALRKAGVEGGPQVGGIIIVQLSARQPNDVPGLSPINKFLAAYTPPSPAAGFFVAPPVAAPVAPPAPVAAPVAAPVPVAAPITPPVAPLAPPVAPVAPAPVAAPVAPPAPVAAPAAPVAAVSAVPRPPQITEAAWAQMDESTRVAVATTFGVGVAAAQSDQPPF